MKIELEQLFHEVADLSEELRDRYLDEHDVNSVARRELDELLSFDERTSTTIERNVGRAADDAVTGALSAGSICGSYSLGKVLGRGGMGTVYLAERVDGEVTQQVAIKLIHAGMTDPRLRRHFFSERQILAGLSHPNVGRLLDVGHTGEGQPYLVMEYIAGQPLDVFAADLGIRDLIALFLKVCAAVSYLHRNLIVHRDLKPGNVLVTPDGEPKILDFGIAKILDLPGGSAVTSLRILTPEYASPEQFAGKPVSTSTDVYSLGAVLYRLLTGAAPHRTDCDPATATADISSMQFPRPSKLAHELKGDLEFILLKSLRADPQERYANVEQFAEDLELFLERRPIRSRKGDRWYRLQKLLRRHWVFATAAALVALSLATGLFIANRERTIAERRFSQLSRLSGKVIDLDNQIRLLPGSIEARKALVSASLQYLEGLSLETRGDRELTFEVADGYWRMARIQGVNSEFNLGQLDNAEASLNKAGALVAGVLAMQPNDRNALFRAALIEHDLMITSDTLGHHGAAEKHAHNAANHLRSFLNTEPNGEPVRLAGFLRPGMPEESEHSGAALIYTDIALAFVNMNSYDEATRYAKLAAQFASLSPSAADLRGHSLSVLANALRYKGDLEGALTAILEAQKATEHFRYPNETARYFNRYALSHREGLILGEADAVSLERPEEAIVLLTEALNLSEELARKDARDSASRGRVGTTARELGEILRDRDPKRSLAVFDLGILRLEEAGGGRNIERERAVLLAKSSYPLRHLNRLPEARARIDAAFALLRETGSYPAQAIRLGSEAWKTVVALADYQAQVESPERALATWKELMPAVMAAQPDPLGDLRQAPMMSRMYDAVEALSARTGDRTTASAMHLKRIDLWQHWGQALPHNAYVHHRLESVRQEG